MDTRQWYTEVMNILYVNGNPKQKCFHNEIQHSYVSGVDADKHTVRALKLSECSFDPVLRHGYDEYMTEDSEIKASQELVRWADHIVFAYPMWWGGMPSLLSGWIARVFTPGEAFRYKGIIKTEKILKGKTADIIVTSRAPRIAWLIGANDSGHPLTRNLFVLTGIKKRKMLVLDQMSLPRDTKQRREAFLGRVRSRAVKL